MPRSSRDTEAEREAAWQKRKTAYVDKHKAQGIPYGCCWKWWDFGECDGSPSLRCNYTHGYTDAWSKEQIAQHKAKIRAMRREEEERNQWIMDVEESLCEHCDHMKREFYTKEERRQNHFAMCLCEFCKDCGVVDQSYTKYSGDGVNLCGVCGRCTEDCCRCRGNGYVRRSGMLCNRQ